MTRRVDDAQAKSIWRADPVKDTDPRCRNRRPCFEVVVFDLSGQKVGSVVLTSVLIPYQKVADCTEMMYLGPSRCR